jgi:hypothetical protein
MTIQANNVFLDIDYRQDGLLITRTTDERIDCTFLLYRHLVQLILLRGQLVEKDVLPVINNIRSIDLSTTLDSVNFAVRWENKEVQSQATWRLDYGMKKSEFEEYVFSWYETRGIKVPKLDYLITRDKTTRQTKRAEPDPNLGHKLVERLDAKRDSIIARNGSGANA